MACKAVTNKAFASSKRSRRLPGDFATGSGWLKFISHPAGCSTISWSSIAPSSTSGNVFVCASVWAALKACGRSTGALVAAAALCRRTSAAIEFHHAGLRLGEGAESAQFHDVHNTHFLWLIYVFQLGDWNTAMGYLDRAEAMAHRFPETLHVALMKGSRGLAHLLKQKSAGDLELLRASLAAAEQAGSHIYRTISRYFLGRWHFLVGEFAEALSHFEAAADAQGKPLSAQLAALDGRGGGQAWTSRCRARAPMPLRSPYSTRRYARRLAWFPSRGGGSSYPWPSPHQTEGVRGRLRGIRTKPRTLSGSRLQARPSSHALRRG
jgi:hypothetical protein